MFCVFGGEGNCFFSIFSKYSSTVSNTFTFELSNALGYAFTLKYFGIFWNTILWREYFAEYL